MRFPAAPSDMAISNLLVTSLALLPLSEAYVSIPVVREAHNGGRGAPPHKYLQRRQGFEQTLVNNLTAGAYYAKVAVGTPPQDVSLIVDTGSSDVWVLDVDADLCNRPVTGVLGGCMATYDKSKSSSFEMVDESGFEIAYLSGESSTGDYIRESFHIGGATIESLQMGLAESSDINSGLIGVGFSSSVAAATGPYPNIMDEFKSQGLIQVNGYSLWLNDVDADEGNILFGAIDTEKFIGEMKTVPIIPSSESVDDYTGFFVAMTRFVVDTSDEAFDGPVSDLSLLPVLLDSGTTISYLPQTMLDGLYEEISAYDDTFQTGLVFTSCAWRDTDMTFEFTFGSMDFTSNSSTDTITDTTKIAVPVREMVMDNIRPIIEEGAVLPRNIPFDEEDVCSLGLQPIDGGGAASRGGIVLTDIGILGDTFLRSAYVVYDLDNKVIGLAQANFNATRSEIVEMDASGIPAGVSGVASQEPYVPTDTPTETGPDGRVVTITEISEVEDENAGMSSFDGTGTWVAVGAAIGSAFWVGVGGVLL